MSLSEVPVVFVFSPDVFDLSLTDCCLQENEETTENGINPELAKVGYAGGSNSAITQPLLPNVFISDYTIVSVTHTPH